MGGFKTEIETAIVFTIGSIAGSIIITQLWQMNWFRRENFKIQKSNMQAENRIKIKKLERELGLAPGKYKTSNDTSLLDSLKGIDINKIKGLLELVSSEEAPEGEGGIMEGLMEFAKSNPEAVQNFLSGLTNKGKEEFPYET